MANESRTGEAKHYKLAEMESEQMSPLLTRQYISGEQAMFARIMLSKGCSVPEHKHPNEQIAIVVSGALEFEMGGVKTLVRTGEVLVIPANVPHAAVALEDTEDWDIFAPPRQDWLDKDDSYLRQGDGTKS